MSKYIDQAGTTNINRKCDKPIAPAIIGVVSELVNGGVNGCHERQAYAHYIYRFLSESTEMVATMNVSTPKQNVIIQFAMSRPS